MSTVLPGEAGATKKPKQDGTPNRPTRGSHAQGPLPADIPTASSTAPPANQQDVRQVPVTSATSGGKDNEHDVPEHGKEKPEEVTASQFVHQHPGALKTSLSLYSPEWDRPPQQDQGTKTTHSLLVLQHEALDTKKTPQTGRIPERGQELAPSTLNADVQSPKTVDANGQPDAQAAGNAEAIEEKTKDPEALNLEAEASLSSEPRVVMEVNLVDSSKDSRAWSYPPTPVGSVAPSPGSQEVALGSRSLNSSLYLADEENGYMRSMTSLLGGGEGSISSLADILVWSDTTMGMATSFLGSGHSSVSDLLHGSGPSLRSVSSILGDASSAFSSGLAAGTGSALRSLTNMLGAVERRTVEGMRSAARFFSGLLTPHRAPAGHTCD